MAVVVPVVETKTEPAKNIDKWLGLVQVMKLGQKVLSKKKRFM